MLSFHPSDLFAKVGDLLVEEVYVPGIRIDQNENTESLHDANVMEYGCSSRESVDKESNLMSFRKEKGKKAGV